MRYTPEQLNKIKLDTSTIKDDKLISLFTESDLDRQQQKDELLSFLGGKMTYQQGELLVDGIITVATCAMLSVLDNPVIKDKPKILPEIFDIEVDRAFYAFACPEKAIEVLHNDLVYDNQANVFCDGLKLNRIEAYDFLRKAINLCFSPLRYLPESNMPNDETKVTFDSLWLTSIICAVREMSGKTIEEITWKMNLTQTFFYYLQYLRKNGKRGIGRRGKSAELWARAKELIKEKLAL